MLIDSRTDNNDKRRQRRKNVSSKDRDPDKIYMAMNKMVFFMISMFFLFSSCFDSKEDSPPIHPLDIMLTYENEEGLNLFKTLLELPESAESMNLTQRKDLLEVKIENLSASDASLQASVYYIPNLGALSIDWSDMSIFNQYNKKHTRGYTIKIKIPALYGNDEFHTIKTTWEVEGYETVPLQVIHQNDNVNFTTDGATAYIKIIL